MPTIDDIAKLADVSHGTVSNVLNKKGNVSVAKIKRVEEAARELGFKINAQARLLRQGQSNRIVLIVLYCKINRYADLHAGLSLYVQGKGYTLEYFQTGDSPLTEMQILEEVAKKMNTRVYKSGIRTAIAIRESQLEDKTIYEYKPKSKVAKDFEAFVDEFLEGVGL